MTEDNEGFLYPELDYGACIDCGLCVRVCHELHPFEPKSPLRVLAAINRDENTRMASSSGGIFSLLAEKTIGEGGVVFGTTFDNQWQASMTYAETMEDVKAFLGSKYMQARVENSYAEAERFLKQGRKVLFSGSPCQIAGLNHFLRKPYDNLTTVDFVCHGVPSPKVWRMYLDEVVEAARRAVSDGSFRNSENGWQRLKFDLSCPGPENTIELTTCFTNSHFMLAFLREMILRPSCHDCRAKQGRSHSDITIADYWGIQREHPEMFDDKGTGLVLVNTEKGLAAIDWARVVCVESEISRAAKYNGGLRTQVVPHPKRSTFFAGLDSCKSVTRLIDAMFDENGNGNATAMPEEKAESTFQENSKLRLVHMNFRDKTNGWQRYQLKLTLKRDK